MEIVPAESIIRRRADEVAEWLHSVIDIAGPPPSTTSVNPTPRVEEYKIRTIPSTLFNSTSGGDYAKYYEPHVVSIGPIHHGKPHLQAMEKFKREVVRETVGRVGIPIAEVYAAVEKDLLSARNCYSPSPSECYADDRDWCLMLFLDGCFIIEFLSNEDRITSGSRSTLNMKKHYRDLVCRDLLLFENQLPFQILHVLARAFAFTEDHLLDLTGRFLFNHLLTISPYTSFIGYVEYGYFRKIMTDPATPTPAHLLQNFRDLWIPSYFREEEEDGAIFEPLSVTELKKMGIRCSCSNKQQYFGSSVIQLKSFVLSGTLFLPRLVINEWTKTLLLNLVAFEFLCSEQDKTIGVWSYLNLMNMLIKGEEDVKELRARGILQLKSISSDQEVVYLLRDTTTRAAPNHRAYWQVERYIFTYSKSKMFPLRVLFAELKHRYFRGPWSFLLFLAVLFTVSMTVIQTVLTAIQTYK
ncbi:UPF0481 protein At3g47200-like [Nicotiana sylvestris]|uniref:UPF0481 protein At3g47200-like n=2 Tax=Nicotiana TaxID=4085 RepID=A0A1S4BFU6_TOBAC|nr:PREDICTED: UPF0481 protein At3g47200-like [Nicotiana sylvestris]XP_016487718.1 PREDICTED: UPF0481 protein At3g47200-like [Nicotiana tabacum]